MTTQPMPGVIKPGWTTTEFWQTLLVQALTAIVAIGAIFKGNFNLDGVQAVVPAVAVLAAALAQAYYNHSRAVVKAAAQNAAAQAASAPSATPPEDSAGIGKVVPEPNGAAQHPAANATLQPYVFTIKGVEISRQD